MDLNQKIVTKCGRIDYMLEGGLRAGEVTEIFGESGVGKTQICLQLLLTCSLLPEDGGLYGSSIYIQACPVFPANRLHQICAHLTGKYVVQENPLSLVHVRKIDSPNEIFLVLNQVELMVLGSHEGCRHTRVVVLDSIAYLFRHAHDQTSKGFAERKRLLVAVTRKIKQIANKYNLAFIVVNEVADVCDIATRSESPNLTFTSGRLVRSSLGLVWEGLMPNRMFISRQFNPNSETWYCDWMVLNNTDTNLNGRRCAFNIASSGLVDE